MTSRITHSAMFKRAAMAFVAMAMAGLLAACGGGNAAPPLAAPPAAAITAQPSDQSAVAGSTATFNQKIKMRGGGEGMAMVSNGKRIGGACKAGA